MRPKKRARLTAVLLSIPLIVCLGCSASDKSQAVTNTSISVNSAVSATSLPASLDVLPLTPCKMLTDAPQLTVPASASQQLNSKLSDRLGHALSWRGQWLSWPAAGTSSTSQDNARVRVWVNDVPVWPDNYLFSIKTLDVSGFDQAHLSKLSGKEAPLFRRDAASVSDIAISRAEPGSNLLDACKVYEALDDRLHARWLVNFARGTSGSSIVVDDFSVTVVAGRPLQYGGP